MDLFRQINNEALDEDRKIQRQVIERIKKQVALLSGDYKAPAELSDVTLNNFNRFVINFDDTINKAINDANTKTEVEDTGDLILQYNLLANYLKKINYNSLSPNDKREINEPLDELGSKLGKLLSVIKVKNYVDSDLVEKVLNNFKNRTYNVLLVKERGYDVNDDSDRDRLLSKLEDLYDKINFIEAEEPTNSKVMKLKEELEAKLTLVENNIYNINEINKFVAKTEAVINKKMKELAPVALAPRRKEKSKEAEVEAPGLNVNINPSLQQGAEEPELNIPQADNEEPDWTDIFSGVFGDGKPKKRVVKKIVKKRK